ncbi:putative S-adenosylmethionine-dependent methyltransferase [Neohortaea acidophila]|uniref:Putative S-adenosylmethionine-dependent methyltransferase n=1 Tax=Neohortaea acidophila TaxID=245834 RepID=A0A6A6PZ72_9PEZI|nr:putative S-adenosylmethionine-dependent methyltransferase [Neohortaea acidophila]KAF2485315.1 putative S-adenosylmethionine-dependent methyltransferase [Neohortaea acidophila]
MTTFAKSTFSAASYAAFRPTYPPALYNTVLAYHRGPKRLCLDLGSGTGMVARGMATRFERVIGTDPSPGMIKQAREQSRESNVEFREGSAENSSFLSDGEVDCVVAGQAAHWFKYAELWPELKRLLRKGGTVAFWGYKDPVLVDFPRATKVLDKTTYGDDPETLGPYWSMPGRRYVQEKLRVIEPPAADFEDVQRVEYEPACQGRKSGEGTLFVEKSLTIAEMKEYYRTFSSFHGWKEAHPGQIARSKGGEGDLIDRMVDEMKGQDAFFAEEGNVVNMEWGSGLVMFRKR